MDRFAKKLMSEKRNRVNKIIIIFFITGVLSFGGWVIEREINYSFSYEDKVIEILQEQIEPLKLRIKALEGEVKILKKERNESNSKTKIKNS